MATTANGYSVWRTVICPKCGAEPGFNCFRQRLGVPWQYERANYHAARKKRYERLMAEQRQLIEGGL